MAINNQDKTEIHNLPEVTTLQPGMMVAVDSEPTGTKSFNLTAALEGTASADDISALESALAEKADASDVAALATTVDGKADEAAMTTALAGKEDKVFVAEVNVTSYDDIDAAYNAGKTIVFKYQPAPQANPGEVYYIKNMQYIPYVGYMCGTINAINCGYFIVCDTNNGATRWTISSFASMPEPGGNPTNGQLLAYNSSGNVWIDSPVPSSTAADSGKVLMVASDGTTGYKNLITAQHTYDSTFPQQTPQVQFLKAQMSGGTPGSDQVMDIVQASMKSSDGQSTTVIGGILVPSISSAGVLQNWSDSNGGHYGWKPVNEVPSSTVSDSGKVLSVDSNGTSCWGNAVGFVKNAGALTDAATITASNLNNGFATLSTSQSALTIIDVVGTDEIVNFAIEITPSVNCTLTIQKQIGTGTPVTMKHSVAGGNTLEANKIYQITAVGSCWTLAEFEA